MRCALLFLLVCSASSLALAQGARPGIRLTVTRIEAQGGFTASGFLIVPSSTVVRTPAPECGEGAVRIDARGRDARGRIRTAHVIAIAAPAEHRAAIGAGPCGASVELVLDDDTSFSPDRGEIRARLTEGGGLDAHVEASRVDAAGVPTTLTGTVTLTGSASVSATR
jgi:hypothetical protein